MGDQPARAARPHILSRCGSALVWSILDFGFLLSSWPFCVRLVVVCNQKRPWCEFRRLKLLRATESERASERWSPSGRWLVLIAVDAISTLSSSPPPHPSPSGPSSLIHLHHGCSCRSWRLPQGCQPSVRSLSRLPTFASAFETRIVSPLRPVLATHQQNRIR